MSKVFLAMSNVFLAMFGVSLGMSETFSSRKSSALDPSDAQNDITFLASGPET